ncbi:MAG: sigma-70 region 4 domain-containing protein [Chromatiales bacterium]|nr:sigma-70 region 4 domain-containing protein [Chromatiales bacterium]
MRKIEEVLRLHHAGGRSNREIAQAVRVSPTTVADYLRRARRAGLSWPLAEGLTERAVEAACCFRRRRRPGSSGRSRIGRRCTASWAGPASRWNCCGRNTESGRSRGLPVQRSSATLYRAMDRADRSGHAPGAHAPGRRLFVDYGRA